MRKSEMVNDIEYCMVKIDNLLMPEIRGLYKRVNALTEYLDVEFALRPAEPEKIVVEKKKKKTS